jgi:hypothetical protein
VVWPLGFWPLVGWPFGSFRGCFGHCGCFGLGVLAFGVLALGGLALGPMWVVLALAGVLEVWRLALGGLAQVYVYLSQRVTPVV